MRSERIWIAKSSKDEPQEIIRLLRECDGSGMSQESFAQQKQISIVIPTPLAQEIWADG
jgi:hypothetical protein